jgi:hypothetical protein
MPIQGKLRFFLMALAMLIVLIVLIVFVDSDPFNGPYIAKLSQVAESGDAEAAWCVYLYYNGKEDSKAQYWLQKSATFGYPRAQYLWSAKSLYSGPAEKKREALDMLLKSAEKGYPLAQAEMGNVYFFGSLVGKDINRSEYWYRRAAEKGVDYAMLPLAQTVLEQYYRDFRSLVEAYSWAIIGYNRSDSSMLTEDQKRLPETIMDKARRLGFDEKAVRQASEKFINTTEMKIASYQVRELDFFSADQCMSKVK